MIRWQATKVYWDCFLGIQSLLHSGDRFLGGGTSSDHLGSFYVLFVFGCVLTNGVLDPLSAGVPFSRP